MRKSLIIITFLFALQFADAQDSKYDSLKNLLASAGDDSTKLLHLLKLSNKYLWSYPDSSLAYIKQAILLAKQMHSDDGLTNAYLTYGWFYIIIGDYPQALRFIQESFKLAEKSENLVAVANAYD